jgi:hypothetical protein
MSKQFFWGKKYVLSSGREADISCEEEQNGSVSVLALINHLDSVHEVTKPLSIRFEWEKANSDAIVSIECRGGRPGEGRPISESELPIDGLNGGQDKLKASELIELLNITNDFHNKIRSEAKAKI